MKWWEEKKSNYDLDYHAYYINNTEVIIGKRMLSIGCDPDFFKTINGWLTVTDTYVEYPPQTNHYWFPWKEQSENFPDTVLFGSLKILNYWINELKLPRIYIHCDAGTHRAPSVFGAFLFAYYKEQTLDILNTVHSPKENSYYIREGKPNFNPKIYFEHKMNTNPLLGYFIEYFIKYPNKSLEDIQDGLKEILPDNLLSKKDLKERLLARKINTFLNDTKKILLNNGYSFVDDKTNEFSAIFNNTKINIWICCVPEESFHGVLGHDIMKGPIHIISPLNGKKYSLRGRSDKKQYQREDKVLNDTLQLTILTLKDNK